MIHSFVVGSCLIRVCILMRNFDRMGIERTALVRSHPPIFTSDTVLHRYAFLFALLMSDSEHTPPIEGEE